MLGRDSDRHDLRRGADPQHVLTLQNELPVNESERAKGAAKASCRETAVQKGVFGESVSSLPP